MIKNEQIFGKFLGKRRKTYGQITRKLRTPVGWIYIS